MSGDFTGLMPGPQGTQELGVLNTGCSCAHLSLVPHLPLQTDVCFWHAADMWLEILLPRPPSGCLGWEQGKDTASELSGIMLSAQWQDLPTPSVSDWEVAGGISTVSPLLCLWHWMGPGDPTEFKHPPCHLQSLSQQHPLWGCWSPGGHCSLRRSHLMAPGNLFWLKNTRRTRNEGEQLHVLIYVLGKRKHRLGKLNGQLRTSSRETSHFQSPMLSTMKLCLPGRWWPSARNGSSPLFWQLHAYLQSGLNWPPCSLFILLLQTAQFHLLGLAMLPEARE